MAQAKTIVLPELQIVKVHLGRLLQERGITQRQFAEMSGIRYGTVGELCTNKTKYIKFDHLALIAQLLVVGLDQIISLEEVPGEQRIVEEKILPKYDNTGTKRID